MGESGKGENTKKNKIGTATGMIAGRRRGKDSDGDPI